MAGPRTATHIDAEIGRCIRARRIEVGITQVELARRLKITFQQLQKHEIGQNRVSAARLYQVAQILEVPFDYFFRDVRRRPGRAARNKTK